MLQYVLRRLLGMIPTTLLLLLVVVILIRLIPGSIIDLMLQESMSAEDRELGRAQLERELGLDRSLPVTYVEYVGAVLHGDLGRSLWDGRPVTDIIMDRVPPTAEVALVAIVVSFLTAIPIGVISAVRQDSWLDYLLRSLAIFGISMPSFAIGTMIVVLPAIWWGWAPSMRYVSLQDDPLKHLAIIVPPAAVLGLYLSASIMRMTRTTMLEVMRQDYIRTAKAKGLRESSVLVRHAVKNGLIPVVTLLGLQLAYLVGGSVITESIFSIPGIGRLMLDSIRNRDYPIIQGVVVVVGIFVMLANLLVDISYAFIDPRIRYK